MKHAMPWRYVVALVVAGVLGLTLACGLAERALLLTQSPTSQDGQQSSEQNEPEESFWQRLVSDPIALLTVLIAFSTCGLWAMAILTARRQLRAYVVLKSADFVEKNESLTVTLYFMNSGQTPAYEYYVFSELGVFKKDFTPPPIIPPDPANADRSIVGPGQERRYIKHITTSRLDLATIKQGRKYGFIWGEVRYRDIFGKPRFLTFTCRTGRDVHGKWVFQPKGNQEAN